MNNDIRLPPEIDYVDSSRAAATRRLSNLLDDIGEWLPKGSHSKAIGRLSSSGQVGGRFLEWYTGRVAIRNRKGRRLHASLISNPAAANDSHAVGRLPRVIEVLHQSGNDPARS